ncbi:hypothetical protein ACLB2K_024721 [Fragaria x ananassa]
MVELERAAIKAPPTDELGNLSLFSNSVLVPRVYEGGLRFAHAVKSKTTSLLSVDIGGSSNSVVSLVKGSGGGVEPVVVDLLERIGKHFLNFPEPSLNVVVTGSVALVHHQGHLVVSPKKKKLGRSYGSKNKPRTKSAHVVKKWKSHKKVSSSEKITDQGLVFVGSVNPLVTEKNLEGETGGNPIVGMQEVFGGMVCEVRMLKEAPTQEPEIEVLMIKAQAKKGEEDASGVPLTESV